MILTTQEKKYLSKLLQREGKRKFWKGDREKKLNEELLRKFEQNLRNASVNDDGGTGL